MKPPKPAFHLYPSIQPASPTVLMPENITPAIDSWSEDGKLQRWWWDVICVCVPENGGGGGVCLRRRRWGCRYRCRRPLGKMKKHGDGPPQVGFGVVTGGWSVVGRRKNEVVTEVDRRRVIGNCRWVLGENQDLAGLLENCFHRIKQMAVEGGFVKIKGVVGRVMQVGLGEIKPFHSHPQYTFCSRQNMTDILGVAFLTVLFDKLGSATYNKLAHYAGIHSEVKKCETSLFEIRDLLNDASQKEITNEYIKRWLNRLQHLAYDIDDILDVLATEATYREMNQGLATVTSKVRTFIPTCCTSFSVGTKMHEKLNNITTKLQDLEKEKVSLVLTVIDGKPINMNRKYETSLPDVCGIVGRQDDKETLLYKLLEEEAHNQNFNIVPIVGMGGVGKTTLARLLYNDTQVKDHFKIRAWVCVSGEFDIMKISKSIFEYVTGENKDFADINLLQEALKEHFMEKQFLLVLDDVWSENDEDWDTLVRPFHAGSPGSKIIMTTRKEQLLRKLGYNHLYHLQSLSYDDALSLFSQHALGVSNFESHPTFRLHGEGIVKKCDGLPLALRALGRLLRTKTEEEEWKELLNNEIWKLQKGDGVVPALRLSYHDLPACLKQLFAYCSLFPKDYMFDKEELILLWMAEGFLHQSTTSTSTTERLGHEYFEELLSRSFFQRAPDEESLFVMHDLMNDLATSVAGDFFLRLDNEMVKDVRNHPSENHRHMSFVCDKFMAYKKFKALEGAKSLRTFLATAVGVKESWGPFHLSNKILDDLLRELPLLRVLRLNCLEIYEVPKSIGSLKHLRYLSLCQTRITHLPENVCNLYNLQTLIVYGCHMLSKLPKSFSKLKNLRHFDIRDTPLLNKLPFGISELRSLQTLSKIIIEGDNGFALNELKNLKNLHGKISIKGLDKVPNAMHAQEANLSQKRLSELEVEWGDVFFGSQNEALEKEVLNELKPHNGILKRLKIVSYGGIEFPNWVGDPSFLRLTHVSIRGCKKCTSIPPLGQLPSLKELFIQGMDGLKVVGSELLGTGAFASLEILSFEDMQGWEVWSTDSRVIEVVFPCLKELCIYNCPSLVEVSLEALPSLRVLKVKSSGHGILKSLVHVASSVINLEIGSIAGLTNELWRGVIEYLGTVEEVRIERCDEIRYLWESQVEACKVLVNLRKLEVDHCENLLSLGEKEEDNCGNNLTSLRTLKVLFCKNMKRCCCPYNIETLTIYNCSSITFVSIPTRGQKLKSLIISECGKLLEKEFGGGVAENTRVFTNSSVPLLEVVCIGNWSNLKSINDLQCFVHLTQLKIVNCACLESFPDRELLKLTSLKRMSIQNCPSMDASFPRGFWPPKLCYLTIGKLKKPISKWGPQNFPRSLVALYVVGGLLEDDVSSFSQLSQVLPSSLTLLFIGYFNKLESLSMGLEHLASLQSLHIYQCPKMKDLPETLFVSLLRLVIFQCPYLEERCGRKGFYRHLTSHVPEIQIYSGDTKDMEWYVFSLILVP
ncbi:hypothetical protein OSB04_011374 [Centaurea solstitialis]|uniref:Uncharacterized protein n=1 Tax=Centaurea solstitialis TaxID=347529 RepID=A0AA38WLG0_9ASTR|nr:hypothetical protein OSB04_011374 [Centaurea solstitialis]